MKMKQLTVAMITLLLTASCSEKQQDLSLIHISEPTRP